MSALDTMRSMGRPIAYHPALAKHVGGVNAAIFLCQLIYWDDRAEDASLGVYKTSEEWEEETGLSYREQAGARKKLRDLGLLTETTQRLKHRIYYKLNVDVFNSLISASASQENSEIRESTKAHSPNDENAIGEQPKAQSGNNPKRSSTNDENAVRYIDIDYTETTTETTAYISGDSSTDSKFEHAWKLYPKRSGGNSKMAARKAWNARIKAGIDPDDMIDGVRRYTAFCAATKRTGTQYVRQAATFFGPDLHFEDDFDIPDETHSPKTNADRNADWNERLNATISSALGAPKNKEIDMGVIDATR